MPQLSAAPRLLPSLSEKQLLAALRHHTYVQRSYSNPARHGADIFAGPLGHCPPCAGAMLAQGAVEVPRAVPAEEPSAAAPPPTTAGSSQDMAQQGVQREASFLPIFYFFFTFKGVFLSSTAPDLGVIHMVCLSIPAALLCSNFPAK